MLAARYLDGSMDALELLLSTELGSQSALGQHGQDEPQHELQPTSLRTPQSSWRQHCRCRR